MNKLALATTFALFLTLSYLLYPPLSPLNPLSNIRGLTDSTTKDTYTIMGFVPYWNLRKVDSQGLNSLTRLAYFALHLDQNGNLYDYVRRGEEDPGFTNYKRLSSLPGDHNLIITYMPIDQKALDSMLTNRVARANAVSTMIAYAKDSGAVGLNVDFEPLGAISETERNNFTNLIKELRAAYTGELSISIYPSAASRQRIWDLPNLKEHTDQFVVMTYDYTLPGNNKSGPNSPLRGAGAFFEHDILSNLKEISEVVDSRQILLGIPFYGYEWKTTDTDKYTYVENRATVASLERIQELHANNALELLWDRNSLTPYAIRREEGEVVSQIYFENLSSIKLKLELVKQAKLGGIAIWALGYEGNNPSLWQLISSELATN